MQQQQRVCGIADHKSQPINYVCVYPKCKTHRFLCSQCFKDGSHNHDQTHNKHIFDANEFHDKIQNDLKQVNDRQVKDYHIAKSVSPLKQIISEIQKQLKIINHVIQCIESGKLLNHDYQYLEKQLYNIQNHGFNQIEEQQLESLINLDKQLAISDIDIYKQFEEKSKLIIQHAQEIKEWRLQIIVEDKLLTQKIENAKYSIQEVHDCDVCHYEDDGRGYDRPHDNWNILSTTISHDLKYIFIGQENGVLKIWDYETCKPIMAINYNKPITTCKFSNDSKFLYVGAHLLYKLDANNKFEEICKQKIHENTILNMLFISDDILLTTSDDKAIIKTDVHKNQQLLKIQAHDAAIYGLDYHHSLEIIASGSNDQSIKLWNGNDGKLLIDKQNAHINGKNIIQTCFLINSNQLVSVACDVIVWNINYQAKQLTKVYNIGQFTKNIGLGLDQQYIIMTKQKLIEIYTIKGQFIRQMDHYIDDAIPFNSTQLESMKSVLILGLQHLQICKIDIN